MKLRNAWLLFGVVILFAASVNAAENQTINTVLNITGNAPNTTVELNEAGDFGDEFIALVENSTQLVSCWGTAEDLDGFNDIKNLTAYLYAESSAWNAASNTSVRYMNDTCNVSTLNTNGNWNCTFEVPYYAENSTWTCLVNITDTSDAYTDNNNDTARIEDLLSLSVNTTLIDFGTKSVDVNDTFTNTPAVVYNLGNVQVDLQLDAWERNATSGVDVDSLSAFNCSVGEIPVEYLKFGLTSTDAYAGATSMVGVGATSTVQFNLDHQNGGAGTELPTFKTSYWGIGVPSGTAGVCQGQVRYIGVASN